MTRKDRMKIIAVAGMCAFAIAFFMALGYLLIIR